MGQRSSRRQGALQSFEKQGQEERLRLQRGRPGLDSQNLQRQESHLLLFQSGEVRHHPDIFGPERNASYRGQSPRRFQLPTLCYFDQLHRPDGDSYRSDERIPISVGSDLRSRQHVYRHERPCGSHGVPQQYHPPEPPGPGGTEDPGIDTGRRRQPDHQQLGSRHCQFSESANPQLQNRSGFWAQHKSEFLLVGANERPSRLSGWIAHTPDVFTAEGGGRPAGTVQRRPHHFGGHAGALRPGILPLPQSRQFAGIRPGLPCHKQSGARRHRDWRGFPGYFRPGRQHQRHRSQHGRSPDHRYGVGDRKLGLDSWQTHLQGRC